jgi:hypothetical protein
MELRAKLPSLRTHFESLAFDSFGRWGAGTPRSIVLKALRSGQAHCMPLLQFLQRIKLNAVG